MPADDGAVRLIDSGLVAPADSPFKVVRVPDQVALVSHVQEVRGAEILPEPVLHPFDLVDEFSNLQDAEARCVQGGFLLDGVCTILGKMTVTGSLGRPSLQIAKPVLQAL